MSRYRRPRLVLTVFVKSQLEAGWERRLSQFWACSVRAVSGDEPADFVDAREILSIAEAQGLQRQVWGGHRCRTITEAQAEAQTAAQVARELRARYYYWNAEEAWAGAPDSDSTAIAFAQTFKAYAPRIKLVWNATLSDGWSFGSGPRDTVAALSEFDVYSPMIYGTKRSSIAKKWRQRVDKFRAALPYQIRAPMVGSGRLTDVGTAFGYFADQGAEPGLLSLVRETSPEWVCFYLGSKGKGMLTVGNARNPPLDEVGRGLHGRRVVG